MTASPAPETPSEETLARWLCAHEGHTPEQVDGLWTEWLDNARELLALIRPAFEAAEADASQWQGTLRFCEGEWSDERGTMIDTIQRARAARLSAEAKLAQAVEALEPFAAAAEFFPDAKDDAHLMLRQNGSGRHYTDMFTVADLRRARTASAIGKGGADAREASP
jgi:hypothetical protein